MCVNVFLCLIILQKVTVEGIQSVVAGRKGVYVFTPNKLFVWDWDLSPSSKKEIYLPSTASHMTDVAVVHGHTYAT